jgi:iron complex transport system substrate-binding protein
VDQLGRTVTIDKIPQKIISLAPANTEILYALGLADKVVAVTDYDDYPPEVKDKPSIGGYSNPNIEKIVSLSPDLILADSIQKIEVIPQLEAKGLTVFALDPKNLDGVMQAITLVGEITGADQAAANLVSQMQSQINAITDKTNNLSAEQKPRVFYIMWHDPLMTVGAETIEDELITIAGGVNITGNLESYPKIQLEDVLVANPEVIIVGTGMGSDTPFQFAKAEPRLAGTSARQNNRIYGVDIDLTGRVGPRLVMGLQQFAECIHPELFSGTK